MLPLLAAGAETVKYTVVLERTPASYGADVLDLPGGVATAGTKAEVCVLVRKAIGLYLEALKEDEWTIAAPQTYELIEVQGYGTAHRRVRCTPTGSLRADSSVGRAPHSRCGGRGFEFHSVHQEWSGEAAELRKLTRTVTAVPQSPGFTMRPAAEEDVPQLLALIHDLAEYEKLTHEVMATEETLLASLFGDPSAAEALLAFADDEPAGFAVYFHTYSTFLARRGMYLHDLYVSPEYRRRGLGTQLLRRVAAIAVERGCGRFEWVALDWNTDAHRFYADLGAEMLPEWRAFRVHGDSLRQLAEDAGESTD